MSAYTTVLNSEIMSCIQLQVNFCVKSKNKNRNM